MFSFVMYVLKIKFKLSSYRIIVAYNYHIPLSFTAYFYRLVTQEAIMSCEG